MKHVNSARLPSHSKSSVVRHCRKVKVSMNWMRRSVLGLAIVTMALSLPANVFAQAATGNITGRATDSSGGALPGVTVSVTSPNLIGGARNAVTDDQGVYRITQLPGGIYVVKFELPGFSILNVEGVDLNAGSTMTINGKLEVASLQETVTVTSQAPTIDLEAASVSVNWDQQKLEEIPYSRSLQGLVSLIPGLYATGYDVGGSNFGTGSAPGARTFGRAGGNVVSYDGMIWDQTYGDYGTYEEAQVTIAAKGAEAMNPGLTMNLVVKSGGNSYRGSGAAQYQDGAWQGTNIDQDLLDQGYSPGVNKMTKYQDFYGEIGGPIMRDRLWFYFSHRDGYQGSFIPGFITLADMSQAEFYTKLQNPTGKVTYQVTQNNKLEGMFQFGRKWQPYRSGDRFTPLEASQNQDSWSLIGPSFKWLSILTQRATFDASVQRGGYWWPDVPWTSDVRMIDRRSTAERGAFLETDRTPRRWQYGATFSYFAELGGKNHELKSGYLGWRNLNDTTTNGYPNQQQYRYRSLATDPGCNAESFYAGCFTRPEDVIVYDYPTTSGAREVYNSLFINDKITVSRNLTLNVGVRWDGYGSYLQEQGNLGVGLYTCGSGGCSVGSQANIFPSQGTENFPAYNTLVPRVSAVYDVTGEGRVALKGSYGRYVGGSSGANANPGPGANDVNPNAPANCTYRWDGSIPYTPVAADLTSCAGGGGSIRTIDLGLRGPGLDEYTAGVDLGISRVVTASFNYVHKRDFGNNVELDLAEPFESFTDQRFGTDPGPDNIVGTSDDAQIPVWSTPRTWPTFGRVIEHTVQDEGEGRNGRYHAFGMVLNKQNSSGWSGLVSLNVDRRHVGFDRPLDPNDEFYNSIGGGDVEVPEWNYSFRMSGTYSRLPWGLQYGTAFSYQSGDWFDREVQLRNALNTTVNLIVQDNFIQLEPVRIWDNRVTKRFSLPRGQRIEGSLDIFNTLNTNAVTDINIRNGSDFLAPEAIIAPRVLRLSLKYSF